ncbi:MAG: Coenzyme F420 hydrogenase/dehydrogenase, beta subunit C-terminal domain [Candidatus Thorarchaeota archaeon]
MSQSIDSALSRAQRWLRDNARRFAFKRLKKDIIDTGVCTECGACVNICPVNALSGETTGNRYVPILTGECVSCGLCYSVCPRTIVLASELLGDLRSVWKVRSTGTHRRQDGGAVTAILHHMLENRIVDAAVVAGPGDEPMYPRPVVVTDPEEVLRYGGTFYVHVPVIEGVLRAMKAGHRAVAVVGTSCNIDAASSLERHPAGLVAVDPRYSIFKVSLFCMESFDHTALRKFIESAGIGARDVRRTSISKGVFRVETDATSREWPLSDIEDYAATSCLYCRDFTGKNADMSCGNIGSPDGWTTVIVRSLRAEYVLQEASSAGLVEVQPLEPKDIVSIENMCRTKAMRQYELGRRT